MSCNNLRCPEKLIGTLIDGIFIGQFLGIEALAAYGLALPLTYVFSLVGYIIAAGCKKLYADAVGQGHIDEANNIFTLACLLAGGTSLVLIIATFMFISPLAVMLGASGQDEVLKPMVIQYTAGFVIGFFKSYCRNVRGVKRVRGTGAFRAVCQTICI